jgi:ABC transport system ATP-binding/permease protein
MALITLKDVNWGLGGTPLIENLTLRIEKGERIGLVGRNGVGKSTLLRLIAGTLLPDSGDIWRPQGLVITTLTQDVPPQAQASVFDVVAGGFGGVDSDSQEGWARSKQIDNILSQAGLNPEHTFRDLSVGLKRRTLFCLAMAPKPDLLLLDEPTNHLDIDTIIWMEDYLRRHATTLLLVTHDRAFLKNTASRIIELDRGRLSSYACDYPTYLKRKAETEQSEANQEKQFDKKLSREEAWIRQGVKARRTRNQGRVKNLEKLRAAFRSRRRKMGNAQMQLQESERTGKLVIEAKGISYAYDGITYIDDFSADIMRGDKIGLIGPNGVGKTTLLKILLQKLTPQSGTVRHGTQLEVAYFDQLRAQLDEQKTVVDYIGEGNDFIIFNDQKRHVISHLQDFLFSPERCRTPVYILSGGEKNRLLLAKLFTKPANVLVLDEPTNDLDLETLELLEDLLLDYTGTLLMVSHDRTFLNNVVTANLAFEGNGRIIAYPGGYDDWVAQRPQPPEPAQPVPAKKKPSVSEIQSRKPKKLGYMEIRELAALPLAIDALEKEQKQLFDAVSDPEFYKKEKNEIAAINARLEQVQADIEKSYHRWETLEAVNQET